MTDESAAPRTSTPVRALLDGKITDGAHSSLLGTLVEVNVARNEQTGLWASGRLLDSTGSVEFVAFPRAYAAADEICFDGRMQVEVTGRLSISGDRTLLVINRVLPVARAAV